MIIFGTDASENVDGLDVNRVDLSRYYTPEQIEGYTSGLKEEGPEYLAGFPRLHEEVVKAYD